MRQSRLPNHLVRLLCVVAGLLSAVPVLPGTWQWRDGSGRMVYSDQPPPASVPASRILRAPPAASGAGTQAATPAVAGAGAMAAAGAGAGAVQPAIGAGTGISAAAPRNWVEKEQASRKRALEREEAQSKQRTEREQAARNLRACEDARTSLRTLESGARVSLVDASGERQVLDDAERARRAETIRQEIARSCTGAG